MPYSSAILSTKKAGDQTLYMAGLLPKRASGELVEDPAQATVLVMDYIAALLQEAGMNVNDLVDVMILVRDLDDIKIVSPTYGAYLTSKHIEMFPVRVCFQAGKLPQNAVLEIKATATRNA